MPDILHEVVIEKSAAVVYNALTQSDHIAKWWTIRVKAEAKLDSIAEFGFDGGNTVFKFKIDELVPGKRVKWSVVGGGPPDWNGTYVTWDLDSADKGTKVLLGHHNYQSTEGSFASVSYSWAWFLTSLKSYLETGTGTPNVS